MDVAVGIVAHTARLTAAEHLANQIDADYMSVDDGTLGCNRNHRKVWTELANHNADWALVLEDDAAPCDHFRHQLDMVLTVAPCDVVSLYLGTSRPIWYQSRTQRSAQRLQPMIAAAVERAKEGDACFIQSAKLFHAVAVAIKKPLAPDMLKRVARSRRPIDFAISDWCEDRGHTVAYTHPSIVEHRDERPVAVHPDRQPRNKPRVAHRFGTRVTWNDTTVELCDGLV